MKDYWKEPEEKKINKRKVMISVIVIVAIIVLLIITVIYINNKNVRNWIDVYILQKEKTQNNLPSIEIESINNTNICAFNKYIGILNKNNFEIYDNTGNKQNNLTIEITKPIFNSNNRYLGIAEVDTSGTMIQSNIKVISVDDAKNNAENSIKKTYNGENNELITNIKYQEKNKILCMYTNKITLIKEDGSIEIIQEYKDKKVSFASIDLENSSIKVEEK